MVAFNRKNKPEDNRVGRSFLAAPDLPWKAAFILLCIIAFWLYFHRALSAFAASPIPSGDSREYYELAKNFFKGLDPQNPWLCRLPGMPLIVAMIWHLSRITASVQYLVGSLAMPAAAAMVSLMVWKRGGNPVLAVSSLALLIFLPTSLEHADKAATDALFAWITVQLVILGYLLPGRPLLYAIPAALTGVLMVLIRDEGRYLAAVALVLFLIRYLKQHQLRLKLGLVLVFCFTTAVLALKTYWNYVEHHELIPMDLRYGITAFYLEFLQGRVVFNDEHRVYALMSFFDWLMLHPVSQWPEILFTGLLNLGKLFDIMLFPGASILTAAGLVRAAFNKWRIEALFCLLMVFLYAPIFYFSPEARYLTAFYCIGLPVAIEGLVAISNSMFAKSVTMPVRRLSTLFPPAFCLFTLVFAHMTNPVPYLTSPKSAGYPDQTRLQEYIIKTLDNRRFEEAADSLEAGLSLNPELAFFHLARGFILYTKGERHRAFEELETSLSLNPYQAEAYHVAFHLRYSEGREDQALAYLERSLEYRPEFPLTRKVLEKYYRSAGHPEKLELLDRKGPFNYYLKNPELRRIALTPVIWWYDLLQRHIPISSSGPASSGQ